MLPGEKDGKVGVAKANCSARLLVGEPHPLNDQSESGLRPRGGTGAYLGRDWIMAGRREGAASLRGLLLGNSALYTAVAAVVVEAGWTAAHVPGSDALRFAA